MDNVYKSLEGFDAINFLEVPFLKGEYDNCSFSNCNLSEVDLSDCLFMDCSFADCNLSMAKLSGTAFRDVTFTGCKMLGLRFDECNDFSVLFNFENCVLNHSSFHELNITKTKFVNTVLEGVDFTSGNLTEAVFDNCNLQDAMFERTNLHGADLRTSYGFVIDPDANQVQKAKFSSFGLAGLLHKYNIIVE